MLKYNPTAKETSITGKRPIFPSGYHLVSFRSIMKRSSLGILFFNVFMDIRVHISHILFYSKKLSQSDLKKSPALSKPVVKKVHHNIELIITVVFIVMKRNGILSWVNILHFTTVILFSEKKILCKHSARKIEHNHEEPFLAFFLVFVGSLTLVIHPLKCPHSEDSKTLDMAEENRTISFVQLLAPGLHATQLCRVKVCHLLRFLIYSCSGNWIGARSNNNF